eukprot:GHVS01086967.1.p1 GENE.GHVS01086967.1~~GHVS01086967.1.p1  ORF type:complete len:356 (+),score=57.22 GHVS01086967.1:3-1070(+)
MDDSQLAEAVERRALEANGISCAQEFEVVMLFLLRCAVRLTSSRPLLCLLQTLKAKPALAHLDVQELELREHIAACLEEEKQCSKAASCLVIPSSIARLLSSADRLRLYARKAELHLKAFEVSAADACCSRAYLNLQEGTEQQLFKYCRSVQAQLLEYKGKYLDAASLYLDVARIAVEDTKTSNATFFRRACVCLLVVAGTSTTKFKTMFEAFVKNDNTLSLYPLLYKMYTNKFIGEDNISLVVDTMDEYQKVLLDSSVLRKHFVQHNLAVASRLYEDITFSTLATLTGPGTQTDLVEVIAAEMIREDTLEARLDQLDQSVVFMPASNSLHRWNAGIAVVCACVEQIATHKLVKL